MAKRMLWMIIIVAFVSSTIISLNGGNVGLPTSVMILSILGVLAVCESIEKLKR